MLRPGQGRLDGVGDRAALDLSADQEQHERQQQPRDDRHHQVPEHPPDRPPAPPPPHTGLPARITSGAAAAGVAATLGAMSSSPAQTSAKSLGPTGRRCKGAPRIWTHPLDRRGLVLLPDKPGRADRRWALDFGVRRTSSSAYSDDMPARAHHRRRPGRYQTPRRRCGPKLRRSPPRPAHRHGSANNAPSSTSPSMR